MQLLSGGKPSLREEMHACDPRLQACDRSVTIRLGLVHGLQFWTFPGEEPHLTPTLLVYADLLASGDARCLETAQLLRGPLLARLD